MQHTETMKDRLDINDNDNNESELAAPILNHLNAPQRQAVVVPSGHVLVLAGAGSGKTRALVHRIAWIMQNQGVDASRILAVTFTNKAASEMKQRAQSLLQQSLSLMWIGTFHGLSHRFLRLHWEAAGLPDNFQIIDADDQLRLIRQIHKTLKIDNTTCPPQKSQSFINAKKRGGQRSKHVDMGFQHPHMQIRLSVYQAYEAHCERSGLVDFTELLLRMYEVLKQNAELRLHYQNRFQHIVVDEFQDTSAIQYNWLRLLTGQASQVMVVGDDDQSIYSWRGAQSDNLLRFQKDFANATVVRLEQNYRSTGNILAAANAVIDHNKRRMGKQLWTDSHSGDPIIVFGAYNEFEEARFVVDRIGSELSKGHHYSHIAILYRSNAQSRVLEEVLRLSGVPYRIYGGQKFFERTEIKDVLAYLRLLVNPHDDSAFERIVNTPTRGIGGMTLNRLREHAQATQSSLWSSANDLLAMPTTSSSTLSARATHSLNGFIALINDFKATVETHDLPDLAEYVVLNSGLQAYFKEDKTEKGVSRLENLDELVTAMRQYVAVADTSKTQALLSEFLAQVALEAGEGSDGKSGSEGQQEVVQLMTLHAAKGLEFPVVFLTGLEEGLLPHAISSQEPRQLEEERRLCYVGMTRACEQLYLTYASTRRRHGSVHYSMPSQFLQEIPDSLLDVVTPEQSGGRHSRYGDHEYQDGYERQSHSRQRYSSNSKYRSYSTRSSSASGKKLGATSKPNLGYQAKNQVIEGTHWHLGQRVKHAQFGLGTIVDYEGQGESVRLQIKFNQAGVKWLVLNYARLEAVG